MRQPPELLLPRWTAPLPPPEMTDDIIIVIPTLDVYVGPKTIAELAEAGATTPAAKASKRQHGAGRHSSPAWPPHDNTRREARPDTGAWYSGTLEATSLPLFPTGETSALQYNGLWYGLHASSV